MLKKRNVTPGALIDEAAQSKAKRLRSAKTIGIIKASENRMFYLLLVSIFSTVLCVFGWLSADKRFAENVQVAWVKLSPNGTATVDYSDEEQPVQYFPATVNSKLMEWVEKRYSKRRETISTDYGFAKLMMSPSMQADFMENEKAATVAAEFESCKECEQVNAKIRSLQPIDKDPVPGSKKRKQYTTLVFATYQNRDKTGRIAGCTNKIITLIWTFRPTSDIVNKRDELRYNPLGQEIIRSDVEPDPTSVSEQECKKL
jgi:hypothetical protein